MDELRRIASSFRAFYDGDCWIGVNFVQALEGVDAQLAARKWSRQHNSIWQLVHHLIYWRSTVLIRLSGKDGYPPFSDMLEPEKVTEAAWIVTQERFLDLSTQLHHAILSLDPKQLHKASPIEAQTNYDLLMGCLQHDAYHMGQIVVLKKGV